MHMVQVHDRHGNILAMTLIQDINELDYVRQSVQRELNCWVSLSVSPAPIFPKIVLEEPSTLGTTYDQVP